MKKPRHKVHRPRTATSKAPKPPQQRSVRIRTAASDEAKALLHYEELKASGRIKRAMVIGEDAHGDVTLLGQGLRLYHMTRLMKIAADFLIDLTKKDSQIKREPLDAGQVTAKTEFAGPALRTQDVTTGPDGNLVPPAGEVFISCGECMHSRFFILHTEAGNDPARYSCASCGNEIKMVRVFHAEAHA